MYSGQGTATVVNDSQGALQPVLKRIAHSIQERLGSKEGICTEMEELLASPSQGTLYIRQIGVQPGKPAQHGLHARIILSIIVCRSNNSVQNARNCLSIIMLIGHEAIRKLIMISAAVLTAQSVDEKRCSLIPPSFRRILIRESL